MVFQIGGSGPLFRRHLQRGGFVTHAVTRLSNYSSSQQHKNYRRRLLGLLEDKLVVHLAKSSQTPEYTIDLSSIISIEFILSHTTCYLKQLDASVDEKALMDNYDFVITLSTNDKLILRFTTAKNRRMWLSALEHAVRRNAEAIARAKEAEEREIKRAAEQFANWQKKFRT